MPLVILSRSYRVAAAVLLAVGGLLPGGDSSGMAQDKLGEATANYRDWKHAGSIYLLTTPDGAELPATASVEGFPLLVRLHHDWFDFSQAKEQGEDIRFASHDGKALAYQIEAWDASLGEASVWVRIPKIQGNARQEVKLYWGNAEAASESNGQAVFNESNGYLSVWHLNDAVQDEVGTLTSVDTGTTPVAGVVGAARHFPGQKGVFCGDKIANYPSAASSHSSEAWFRAERPNATILGWGNEGGGRGSKVRMLLRSPPHVHIDSDFSDVNGESRLPLGEWVHVVHTYDKEDGKIYINGRLDGAARPPLNIKRPARMWIGGWYNQYDFVGDIDEVRISQVARSADWIRLQYENQKPLQTLVGPLVQSGDELAVSHKKLALAEGESATVTAKAGGAQKLYWILKQDGRESVVATDRFSYTFQAGRVVGDQTQTLLLKAIDAKTVRTVEIAITIAEAVPEPSFTLEAPASWDGRETVEIVPQMSNLAEMQAQGAGRLNYQWSIDGIAVIKQVQSGKLILKRAQGIGPLQVSATIDNGGEKITQTAQVVVTEPSPRVDPWVLRPVTENEQPEDNQFYARDYHDRDQKPEGTLVYAGTLAKAADTVFVRVFADDQLFATQTDKPTPQNTYSLAVQLKAGLVKYRTEFGTKTGDTETVLHTAANLVCGDVFLINGQSNAVATDFGDASPPEPSEWVRTFGATDGGPQGSRLQLWADAQARGPGGKSEIGYWGMELGRRLVEITNNPICIVNGAVGGTRIDQHQRNEEDPTDANTIYGRLLWRMQQARLTHGVRAVLWHQGENDQGADGPTGGYGWETYRQYFVDLSAAWKEDYPNIQAYYVFQIWPKACAMGINGSDNRLREVQRTLPKLYSNLSVMSTLGIKPPGGCHFPAAGYAEFARLICPLMEYQLYHRFVDGPGTPLYLKRALFTSDQRDEIVLEFDYNVGWSDTLTSQFYLDGEAGQIASGAANGNRITLRLKSPSQAGTITYLDGASWSPDNLLYGQNGMAALTFCHVPIEAEEKAP